MKEAEDDLRSGHGKLANRNDSIYASPELIREFASLLSSRGVSAVRMGKFPDPDRVLTGDFHVWDYRNSEMRTDVNDIILMNGCSVAVVQGSGLWALARSLGRPVAWWDFNLAPHSVAHLEDADIWMPVTLWSAREHRMLRLEEHLQLGDSYWRSDRLNCRSLSIVPPSSDMIRDFVQEVTNRYCDMVSAPTQCSESQRRVSARLTQLSRTSIRGTIAETYISHLGRLVGL